MAWYQAVERASRKNPYQLDLEFGRGENKVRVSGIWLKYRRGDVVPRASLVSTVERRYPETARWLALPLWTLLVERPVRMSEIRQTLLTLDDNVRNLIVHDWRLLSRTMFWLKPVSPPEVLPRLQEMGTLSAGTAIMALVRYAEVTLNPDYHAAALAAWSVFLKDFKKEPVLEPVIPKLREMLARRISQTLYTTDGSRLARLVFPEPGEYRFESVRG
jgi:hypothetical protein